MGNGYMKCWAPSVKEAVIDLEFIMTTGKLHLDVSEWLKHLELDNYLYLFQKFRGVEEMLSLSERDLKDLGIKNGSHRAIIATSLVILRDKYEKGHRNKTGAPRGSVRKSRSCDSSPRESWTSNTCKNRASWNSTKEGNQGVIHSFSLSRKPSTGTEEATSSEEKLENGRIALLSRPPLDNVTRHAVEQNSCVTYSNLPSLPKKSSNSTVGEDKQPSCDTVPFLVRKSSDSLHGVNNNVDQPTAAPSLPLKTSMSVERGVVVKFQTSENKAPSLPRKISSGKQLEDVQQQQQVINSVPPLPRKNLSVRGNIEKEQQIFNTNLSKKPCERTNVVDSVDLGTTAKTSPDTVSVIKEITSPPTVKGSENCLLNTESPSEYCSNKGSFQISNESVVRVPLVSTSTTENKEAVYANTPGTSPEDLDDVRDTGRSHTCVASDYNVRNDRLHSCTWYHGSISRHRAEQLTCEDGDFLVRDQTSRDGSFVLTCRWNDHPLHFVIEKVHHQQRLVYQFADKNYNSITELVTYLMENKTVLSSSLNAVLIHPVARTAENAHPVLLAQSRDKLYQQPQPEYQNSNNAPRLPPKKAPLDKHQSAPVDLCSLASSYSHREPTKSEQTLSLPSIPDTEDAKTRQHGSDKEQLRNRPTGSLSPACTAGICNTLNVSSTECSLSNPKRDLSSNDKPPPKPSRIPSIKYTQNPRIFSQQISDNYFEKGVLTTDKKFQTLPAKPVSLSKLKNAETEVSHHTEKPISIYTTDPGQQTGKPVTAVPPLTPKKLSNDDEDRIKCPNKIIQDEKGNNTKKTIEIRKFTIPDMKPPSTFCLSTFSTVLLPSENKPLDNSVKARITSLLKENGPKLLAIHLSKNDFDVFKYTGNHDLGLGVKNGLELLTLPQGEQLRKDILERFECTKYLVAATVLTIEEPLERAQLVSKWIEVAVNSKTSLGNLYGFSGVMKGLSLPQVSRLQDTWLLVRQNFTENAFTYESKMRPLLKSLEINSETEASNSCIPYLVCLISILQRHLEMIKQIDKSEKIEINSKEAEPVLSPLLPWEHTTADYGLQMLLNHLETGRTIVQELHKYQKKCETLTENVKYDDQLLDLFRTEFHLKFLWGSKGAKAFSEDRYLKLEQILTLLSQNREPN